MIKMAATRTDEVFDTRTVGCLSWCGRRPARTATSITGAGTSAGSPYRSAPVTRRSPLNPIRSARSGQPSRAASAQAAPFPGSSWTRRRSPHLITARWPTVSTHLIGHLHLPGPAPPAITPTRAQPRAGSSRPSIGTPTGIARAGQPPVTTAWPTASPNPARTLPDRVRGRVGVRSRPARGWPGRGARVQGATGWPGPPPVGSGRTRRIAR